MQLSGHHVIENYLVLAMVWLKIVEFELNNNHSLYCLFHQLYGLWFNLQTVEDGDLESAIQMTELVRSC
jgi:hypothetical protein